MPDSSTETISFTPDFLGIGGQRCATTWLFHCLREHPEIFLPETKEVHYFDENYDRGGGWYAAHFAGREREKLTGEITPNYLDSVDAAARIARDCPRVKLFAVLREPVARAWSSYELLGHRFRETSFDEACRPGHYLVELGLYAKHLRRFFDHFDRRQVAIFLYDDIQRDPAAVLRDLYGFLGVDADFAPPSQESRANAVVLPGVQRWLSRWRLEPLVELVKRTPLAEPIKAAVRRRGGAARRRGLSPEQMARCKSYFRQDVLELQQLIDRDLSHWL